MDAAVRAFGPAFASVLATATVWCNGEQARATDPVRDADEVAVLPPVSGGAATAATPPEATVIVVPRGRLGAAWTVTAFAAAFLGAPWLAGWLGLSAVAAAAQTMRRDDGSTRQTDAVAAIGLAAAIVTGSVFGPWVLVVTATALAIAVGAQRALTVSRTGRHSAPRQIDLARPVVVGTFCGLAAAGPVIARVSGLPEAFAVLGLVAAYDVGSFVVGTGAVNEWEGPAAGVASVAAATLAVAALCVPPFRLAGVAVLGLIVATAGPAGVHVARRLLGRPKGAVTETPSRVSMLYRISTLLVAGPLVAVLLPLLVG
jgi:hypothetical protein